MPPLHKKYLIPNTPLTLLPMPSFITIAAVKICWSKFINNFIYQRVAISFGFDSAAYVPACFLYFSTFYFILLYFRIFVVNIFVFQLFCVLLYLYFYTFKYCLLTKNWHILSALTQPPHVPPCSTCVSFLSPAHLSPS